MTSESFLPPEDSLLEPDHRARMVSNDLTGERLAQIFDIIAADAKAQECKAVSYNMTWGDEDPPKVGTYVPCLVLMVKKVLDSDLETW